jgi:hypothetical protein
LLASRYILNITQNFLSPILFVIYLEHVLQDLANVLKLPCDLLKNTIAYADDCDFRSENLFVVDKILAEAPAVFAKWSLKMNISKTEITHIEKRSKRSDEYWRNVKKLGSLLGDIQDVSRRKQLATTALNRMWKIWTNQTKVCEDLRISIYNAYVKPVLLYNCGTWGLTQASLSGLESFHRRQLRRVIGIFYPATISCNEVYKRCKCLPLRFDLLRTRWKCFGHILRRSSEIPANTIMVEYFKINDKKWRGKDTMCLPLRLHEDLKSIGSQLKSTYDLIRLSEMAQDRHKWDSLIEKLHNELFKAYQVEKEQKEKSKKER